MPCYLWYERVASCCNPADLPSRRKVAEACTSWNLDFGGHIIFPGELLTTVVDGEPFPKLAGTEGTGVDLQSTGANTKIHQSIEVSNRQSGHRCVTSDLKNKSRQVTNKPCECSPDSSKKNEIVRVSSSQHPPFVYGSFGMCFCVYFIL